MRGPKNPKGAKSDKWWRKAIERAVCDEVTDPDNPSGKKVKALRLLATKLVKQALKGDVVAMKEIGDRLDGRPTQGIEASVDLPELDGLSHFELARRLAFILAQGAQEAESEHTTH